MPTPQSPEDAAALIDRVASAAMGTQPNNQQQPPAQQQAQQPPAQQPPAAQGDTPEAQAVAAGAPKTEADAMSADPIVLEIPMADGSKRTFTPEQVSGLLDRYSSLNHRHAQLAPVLSVIDSYMKSNPNMTPAQLANTLQDLARANQHNAKFGSQVDPQGANKFSPEALKQWEEENAASLPPGYSEMLQQMQLIAQTVGQQSNVMRALMAKTAGVADAARTTTQNANQQQINAIRQTIASNLDRAQQALGLPDALANDFNIYASERGYTMEDFIDGRLLMKVMSDFKNNLNSPEMERLRQIAQRRAAAMGGMGGSAPSAQGGQSAQQQPSQLDQLVDAALAKRNP